MIPDIDELFELLSSFGEKRFWHLKYAKFNRRIHQSLLAHSLNVGSLSLSLLEYLEAQRLVELTPKLRIQIILTGFLHDAGKEQDSYQNAVENYLKGIGSEPLDFGHQHYEDFQATVDSLRKFVEDEISLFDDSVTLWDEIVWSITSMGRREDAAAVSQNFKRAPSDDALLCKEIVHAADLMMSKRTAEETASVDLNGRILPRLQLTFSKVSAVRGILTQFLHMALEEQFTEAGFKPILWFPNGTVYVGTADMKVPMIDSQKLVNLIRKKMDDILLKSRPLQMAKASYGNLMWQVIAAPEFLFTSDKVIHAFWQYIARQKFAKFAPKRPSDLKDTEKTIYKLISDRLTGEDELNKLVFLGRYVSDFNLLIVLFAARKELLDKAKAVGVYEQALEEEATRAIHETLAETLNIPIEQFTSWPEIAFQTKSERRLPVITTLWLSTYYSNPDDWQSRFLNALESATIKLADLWNKYIPNKYSQVAHLLLSDVSYPLDPRTLVRTLEDLTKTVVDGKTGHGTPTCQQCGGVATCEAQAKLFVYSEIYHDNLIAGSKVGGGNKIRVCELCEFEEKLRSVFITRGREPFSAFYIFPHFALSRNQHRDWQKKSYEIAENRGKLPSLLQIERWAEIGIQDNIGSSSPLTEKLGFSTNQLAWAIEQVAEENGLEDDLSSMIDIPLDVKDGKTLASYLNQGKCKMKDRYEKEVYQILNRFEPVYLSPNFLLFLTRDTVADSKEPESSAAIKWLFVRLLLARRFLATVLTDDSVRQEGAMLGYTMVPANIVLKSLDQKIGRKGWVPIPELDMALKRLAALFLIARELSNADASYGNATLLRLLKEEPGRVLVRITNGNKSYPRKVLPYLEILNCK